VGALGGCAPPCSGGRRYRVDREPDDWRCGLVAPKGAILVSGVAGLVAGAMSMAVGEYVSVSSQRDAERRTSSGKARAYRPAPSRIGRACDDLRKARPRQGSRHEGCEQLSARDRLGAHMRDELGIDQAALSRPIQRHGYRPQALRLCHGSNWCSSCCASPSVSHDRRAISGEPCGSRRAWWSSRRRATRPCIASSRHRGAMAMAVTAAIGWILSISIAL